VRKETGPPGFLVAPFCAAKLLETQKNGEKEEKKRVHFYSFFCGKKMTWMLFGGGGETCQMFLSPLSTQWFQVTLHFVCVCVCVCVVFSLYRPSFTVQEKKKKILDIRWCRLHHPRGLDTFQYKWPRFHFLFLFHVLYHNMEESLRERRKKKKKKEL